MCAAMEIYRAPRDVLSIMSEWARGDRCPRFYCGRAHDDSHPFINEAFGILFFRLAGKRRLYAEDFCPSELPFRINGRGDSAVDDCERLSDVETSGSV